MSILTGLRCDTPDCGSQAYLATDSVAHARDQAAHRYGWTHTAGLDHCHPCTIERTPDTPPLVAENFPTDDATRRTDQKPV